MNIKEQKAASYESISKRQYPTLNIQKVFSAQPIETGPARHYESDEMRKLCIKIKITNHFILIPSSPKLPHLATARASDSSFA